MSLVLGLLSKHGTNPRTGRPVTVNYAFQSISRQVLKELNVKPETAIELNIALARAFYSEVKIPIALAHYSKARKLLENDGKTDLRYAECLRYIGVAEGSVALLTRAASIEKAENASANLSRTLALTANLRLGKGELDEAEELARESVGIFSSDESTIALEEMALFVLSEVQERREQTELRTATLERAVTVAKELKGAHAAFWWLQVERWAYSGRIDVAKRALHVADSFDSSIGTTWLRKRGITCRDRGVYDVADQLFIRSQKFGIEALDAGAGFAPAQRARLRVELHAFDDALQYLDRAIDLMPDNLPDNYWLLFEKGLLLRDLGRLDEARECFQAAYDACNTVLESGQPTSYSKDVWRTARDTSGIALGLDMPFAEMLEEYAESNAEKFGSEWFRAEKRALCYDALKDVENAMDEYTICARLRDFHNEAYNGDIAENRLLELGEEHGKLNRVTVLFKELLKKRNGFLPEYHPGRAFTRERLAKALILEGKEPELADELLKDALTILDGISMAPESAKESIRELRAQVRR
jgi:tetratricopeptide (TPR) repeat protein